MKDGECYNVCPNEKEYFVQEFDACLKCGDYCLKCQNETGICEKCQQGLEYYEDFKACWYSSSSLEIGSADEKISLAGVYFDQLVPAVVLAFNDTRISERNIPKKYRELQVELIEGKRTGTLKVENSTLKSNLRIFELEIPSRELNMATIKIRTSLRIEELNKKKRSNSKNESPNDNQGRILERVKKIFEAKIESVSYCKAQLRTTVEFVAKLVRYSSFLIAFIFMIFDLGLFVSFIKFLQFISFLRLLSPNLPINITIISKNLSRNILSIVPNPIRLKSLYLSCRLPQSILKTGMGCSGLHEYMGVILLEILVISIVAMVIRWRLIKNVKEMMSGEKKQKFLNIVKLRDDSRLWMEFRKINILAKAYSGFSEHILNGFLAASQVELMVPALISLRYGNWDSLLEMLDRVICLIVLIGYVLYWCYTLYNIFKLEEKEIEKINKKTNEESNKQSQKQKVEEEEEEKNGLTKRPTKSELFRTELIEVTCGLIFSLSLTLIIDTPITQICLLLIPYAFKCIYIPKPCLGRVYQTRRVVEVVTRALMLSITLFIIPVVTNSLTQMILKNVS